ncbi:hypothetical protein GO730_30910 [Spirosoma sp. HMF3257]|uniref:Dystroglycan-type cadherin-like domain-containing protein n=1 Tax=Spirosoma telluris TaxID=2183553 RepID=A0A327NU13_9BACT|nr:hypothetical protein [Spirosoma telluris]RAI77476.1 hypothetical protein HMF3257_30815 [Spirosoma telluris]
MATADRSSDGSYSLYGMLKRITYPTKGYTEITYEPNRVKYSSMTPVPRFMRDQNVLSGYTLLTQDALSDCNQQTKTGTFSVAQNLVGVRISWELQGYSNPGNNVGSSFDLTNPTAGLILVSDSYAGHKTGSTRIDLPAGTYTYTLRVGCQTPQLGPALPTSIPVDTSQTAAPVLPPPLASFSVGKPVSDDITLAIGGNRVQKVVDYDQSKGYNERVITYNQATLLNKPDYITTRETPSTTGQLSACFSLGHTNVVNERTIYNWDGFHVSYRQVTESFGQGGINGQKTYTFDDVYYLGVSFDQAPYPPAQNIPWRTANLLTENSYRKNPDSSFELVAKSGTSYTSGRLSATANGKKIERILACPTNSGVNEQSPNTYFNSITVPVFSDQFGVEIKTEEQWFGTNVLSQSTSYSYNTDWLVNRVATTNSKNQPEEVLTYYANDYENSASPHIGSLKTINAIGVPVKTIRTVNGQAVEGVLTRTDALGNPIELYRLDVAAPVTLTHDRNTFMPSGFNLFQNRQYSSKGNITQITPRNGPTRTYIWGYNHTYPIAEVVNATQSQVEGIGGVGSLESVATVMADASVQNIGTALRSGLTTSLVTSTVMQSGVGIKQLTAPSGLNTNYVYDGVNRLSTISNNKNEIVKEYTYNYRDPNASVGTSPDGNQSPSSTGTISDQLATVNQAYTYTVLSSLFTDPENQGLTYTVSGLPAGLSYSNYVISGTPSALGQSSVTVTATDPGGLSSSITFFLTVGTCFITDPYIVTGSFSSAISISAVNRIETDAVQQVLVNPSASLTLKAGQSVKLKAGFVIKPGAAFRAYTGPCN